MTDQIPPSELARLVELMEKATLPWKKLVESDSAVVSITDTTSGYTLADLCRDENDGNLASLICELVNAGPQLLAANDDTKEKLLAAMKNSAVNLGMQFTPPQPTGASGKYRKKPVVIKIEPIYAQIGQRIRVMRELRGLSQQEIGEACSPKLTRAGIANMESGTQRIMVHNLLPIAFLLRVPVTFLLSGAERRGKRS